MLGCWAPYPRPGEACSGYLLQSEATALMLEAGNGSFSELGRHMDFRKLSGLVITHFHPDHYVDVFCLRHAIEGALREGHIKGPINLYIPANPKDIYNKLASYTEAFNIVNIDDLPKSEEISGLQARKAFLKDLILYFVPTAHALPGYAVLAKQGEKTFLFSGDTARTEVIEKAAHDVDLFLCEASGLEKDAEYLSGAHMTASESGALARRAQVKQFVITHFWPEYKIEELQKEACEGFAGQVKAAAKGLTFYIK